MDLVHSTTPVKCWISSNSRHLFFSIDGVLDEFENFTTPTLFPTLVVNLWARITTQKVIKSDTETYSSDCTSKRGVYNLTIKIIMGKKRPDFFSTS